MSLPTPFATAAMAFTATGRRFWFVSAKRLTRATKRSLHAGLAVMPNLIDADTFSRMVPSASLRCFHKSLPAYEASHDVTIIENTMRTTSVSIDTITHQRWH